MLDGHATMIMRRPPGAARLAREGRSG
jgi:hypothetical protein